MFLLTCSKEENIPYIAEDRVELNQPVYYLKLDGTYHGILSNITFGKDSNYVTDFSTAHTITIEEIDFSNIRIKNVTNIEQADAVCSVQRFNTGQLGAFFYMDKTINNIAPIRMFSGGYNGKYLKSPSGQIQYFFSYTDYVDTVYQVFDGQIIQ